MSAARTATGSQADADALYLAPNHPWATRLPRVGAVLAAAGLGASLVFGASQPAQLWHSWLVATLFVLTIALGGLFFVLTQHATQAGWSVVIRRIGENAMATLPLLSLLLLALLFGLHELFHWTHAEAVAADPLLTAKSPYLNVSFFVARTVLYVLAWSAMAAWFGRLSVLQDTTGDHQLTRRMRRASAPALIVFALTVTFASFDWVMSLDPHWYSTIFGVYLFSGCLVGFFAFQALVVVAQRRAGLLAGVVHDEHLHDVGKLLFAFVAFWAYIAFSQYFLIWYGNLPEETGFYAHRLHGSWQALSVTLALGHFVVPFFFLLPRTIKRHPTALAAGAAWMLLMHLLDLYWLVMPNLHPEGARPSAVDLTTLAGASGLFLLGYGWFARRRALVPVRDPRLAESLTFENV